MPTNPSTTTTESPVDDATYDLLQALTSKLEAIEAYQMYAEDDGVRDLIGSHDHTSWAHPKGLVGAATGGPQLKSSSAVRLRFSSKKYG